MSAINYQRATLLIELQQIIELQYQNDRNNLSGEEQNQEGFITVQHNIALLEKMNKECAHILAKRDNKVIGFALVMLPSFRNEIEILKPMFEEIELLVPKNKNYVVMGQICIDKPFRRQGVFRGLYEFFKTELQFEYNYLFTEVSALNIRSMNAHESIGFKINTSYISNGVVWNIISWDWT